MNKRIDWWIDRAAEVVAFVVVCMALGWFVWLAQ